MKYLYYQWKDSVTEEKQEYVFTKEEYYATLFWYKFDENGCDIRKVYPLYGIEDIESEDFEVKTLSGETKTVKEILQTQKKLDTKLIFAYCGFANLPDDYMGNAEVVASLSEMERDIRNLYHFLQKNNISWQMERFDNPTRYYITLKQDNLEAYIMGRGCKYSACGEGETSGQAVLDLIGKMRGNRLRINGWNSKDEYIDLTIKVQKDLKLGEKQ